MRQVTLKGKQIFITGGAGFIGSTLIERLIDDNKITVYDNFRRDALSAKSYSSHPHLEKHSHKRRQVFQWLNG